MNMMGGGAARGLMMTVGVNVLGEGDESTLRVYMHWVCKPDSAG